MRPLYPGMWSVISQITALVSMAVARIAVIALLLAILGRISTWGKAALCTTGGTQLATSVISIVMIILQCDPPAKLWDVTVVGKCTHSRRLMYVAYLHGSIGAAADIFLAFYPVFVIGRLQAMRLQTKFVLCTIMSGGVIATIAGINRTATIPGHTSKIKLWTNTEMWFIIIFGSIPVLRAFFVRFTQDIKKSTTRKPLSDGSASQQNGDIELAPRRARVEGGSMHSNDSRRMLVPPPMDGDGDDPRCRRH